MYIDTLLNDLKLFHCPNQTAVFLLDPKKWTRKMPYGGALRRLWHTWARKYPETTLECKNSARLPASEHISLSTV